MLGNVPNQPSKFRTKTCVKIIDGTCRTNNINSQNKFKTTVLKASLSDYGNAYIVVKGAITVANVGTIAAPNNRNIKVIFENSIPFTDCKSKINNTEVDNATDIDIVTPMYSLIEYSNN